MNSARCSPGQGRCGHRGPRIIGRMLEAVYLGLLVLASLAIAGFGVLVLYKLFAGQR